jgi:hypothetical protein
VRGTLHTSLARDKPFSLSNLGFSLRALNSLADSYLLSRSITPLAAPELLGSWMSNSAFAGVLPAVAQKVNGILGTQRTVSLGGWEQLCRLVLPIILPGKQARGTEHDNTTAQNHRKAKQERRPRPREKREQTNFRQRSDKHGPANAGKTRGGGEAQAIPSG